MISLLISYKGWAGVKEEVVTLVTDEMNHLLTIIPTEMEIWKAIQSLDPDSAPGLDGRGFFC